MSVMDKAGMTCSPHYLSHKQPTPEEQCPGGYVSVIHVSDKELAQCKTYEQRMDLVEAKCKMAQLSLSSYLSDSKLYGKRG